MRFVQFVEKGRQCLGVLINREVVNLNSSGAKLPNQMVDFLKQGDQALEIVRRTVDRGSSRIPVEAVKMLAPITDPGKILCIGLNYFTHCKELGLEPPKEPVIFNKLSSSIIGPEDDIVLPPETQFLDWEVELAVVIGKPGKRIPLSEAMNHVFGYTVANDISARDWFSPTCNGGQWIIGKSMDTFCPLGPAVVTRDEIPDFHNLKLKCKVNGETKQEGITSDMVHGIDSLVSVASRFFTLYPGDLLLTGTPLGVGFASKPQQSLKKGDLVESEIEGIGRLSNKVS